MDMNGVMEAVLALALLYSLLSLVASGLQELISGWLNFRGRLLHKAIGEMLMLLDTGKNANSLLAHPSALSMARPPLWGSQTEVKPRKSPSYLPAEVFVNALLHHPETTGANVATLRAKVAQLPGATSSSLSDEEVLARWYDQTMERVSGRYARKAKTWLFIIGVGLAAWLNADTWRLMQTFAREPALRRAAANLAESTHQQLALAVTSADTTVRREARDKSIALLRQQLDSTAVVIPLGWAPANRPFTACNNSFGCKFGRGLLFALGIVLTGVAVSFGAPFWFDVLSKVSNVRAAGRKPEVAAAGGGNASVTVNVGSDSDRPREVTGSNPPRP